MLAGDDGLEVMARLPVVQMALDDGHGAGRGHRHRDVVGVQPRQKLVKARHLGHGLGESLVGQPVQLFHDARSGAAVAVEAAEHIAGAGSCRAPGGLREAFLIRKAELCQRWRPAGIPDALGVEHQPVHVENNALYHKTSSSRQKIVRIGPIVSCFPAFAHRQGHNL